MTSEYVDAGESAKTAHRPQLQQMLADIRLAPPDYLIVHKIDRLARNREDDIAINLLLKQYNVKLISCTENIDDSPSGKLLYGLMAEIAQFYSRNLAQEVMKGLVRKAEEGGTPYRAPLGYINRREMVHGVDRAWVELDAERAEIVRWCFVEYATGQWSAADLTLVARAKGLTSRPTATKPAMEVGLNTMYNILRNPYYIGVVSYRGISYEGKHPKLVEPETWLAVQDILAAHAHRGEKDRVHNHYLRSTIYCSACEGRLVFSRHRGNGGTYDYFHCVKKKTKTNNCRRPAVRIERIEAGIAALYAHLQIDEEKVAKIQSAVQSEMSAQVAHAAASTKRAQQRRARLEDERQKLLQAHYAGAIPQDLLAMEMQRLTRALAETDSELQKANVDASDVAGRLNQALHVASNCAGHYDAAPTHIRRQINQGFFKKLFIDDDGAVERYALTEPFEGLLLVTNTAHTDRSSKAVPDATGPVEQTEDAARGTDAPVDLVDDRSRPSRVFMTTFGHGDETLITDDGIDKHTTLGENMFFEGGVQAIGVVGAAGFEPATARV